MQVYEVILISIAVADRIYRKSSCYHRRSQLCWIMKSRSVSMNANPEAFESILTLPGSYRGPRQSSAFGHTCVLKIFKTQMTSE